MTFDLATSHGHMIATLLAGVAEFERELTVERIRSGIAAAKARSARLGRQTGDRPKSDRLAPKVLALVEQDRSYRLIGREIGLSKNTVAAIVKRHRQAPGAGEFRYETPAAKALGRSLSQGPLQGRGPRNRVQGPR